MHQFQFFGTGLGASYGEDHRGHGTRLTDELGRLSRILRHVLVTERFNRPFDIQTELLVGVGRINRRRFSSECVEYLSDHIRIRANHHPSVVKSDNRPGAKHCQKGGGDFLKSLQVLTLGHFQLLGADGGDFRKLCEKFVQ